MTRAGDDRGNTLIEMLVAMMILALVFVGVLSSMGTSTLGARAHRDQTNAHTVLLSAVERVKSPVEVAYVADSAGVPSSYVDAVRGVDRPEGWESTTVSIQPGAIKYWDGSNFTATCNDANPILRLQEITVTVKSPDGDATESLSVVKRGAP